MSVGVRYIYIYARVGLYVGRLVAPPDVVSDSGDRWQHLSLVPEAGHRRHSGSGFPGACARRG